MHTLPCPAMASVPTCGPRPLLAARLGLGLLRLGGHVEHVRKLACAHRKSGGESVRGKPWGCSEHRLADGGCWNVRIDSHMHCRQVVPHHSRRTLSCAALGLPTQAQLARPPWITPSGTASLVHHPACTYPRLRPWWAPPHPRTCLPVALHLLNGRLERRLVALPAELLKALQGRRQPRVAAMCAVRGLDESREHHRVLLKAQAQGAAAHKQAGPAPGQLPVSVIR